MTTVEGHERLTVTSARVAEAITRRAMARVSTRASGWPSGTFARAVMSATAAAGTPWTRTVRAARTGLNHTSQARPASRATIPRLHAASSHARGEPRPRGGDPGAATTPAGPATGDPLGATAPHGGAAAPRAHAPAAGTCGRSP